MFLPSVFTERMQGSMAAAAHHGPGQGRSGKESRLLSAAAAQQLRAVLRQSARSDGRSAVAARKLTTSGATGLLPEVSASRGEESAYRITPCWPITNVGREFLMSESQTIANRRFAVVSLTPAIGTHVAVWSSPSIDCAL